MRSHPSYPRRGVCFAYIPIDSPLHRPSLQLFFKQGDFAKTAQVPFRLAVLRSQVCLDEVPCHCWPYRAATHAEYVHVIIFDTLMGGEMTVYEARANAAHFVRAYSGPDSTA